MRSLVRASIALALLAPACGAPSQLRVRGSYDVDAGTVTACDTGEVHEIAVLASNPNDYFYRRVRELSEGSTSAPIIVDLQGPVAQTSAGDAYLSVWEIHEIDCGRCP